VLCYSTTSSIVRRSIKLDIYFITITILRLRLETLQFILKQNESSSISILFNFPVILYSEVVLLEIYRTQQIDSEQ
ncbi:MAG: hypothetical protein ACI8RD_014857, partial [Bacillariaceae sp.]|jgi:hypothetical protein